MNDQIIEEVTYYVSNLNITKKDVACHFKKSISSIKKDFAKFRQYVENCLENNIQCDYIDLYYKEQQVSSLNEITGRKKGSLSTNSGRLKLYTTTQILEICKYIIKNQATLETASERFHIPSSTLYENIESLKTDENEDIRNIYIQIKNIYDANKHNIYLNGNHK